MLKTIYIKGLIIEHSVAQTNISNTINQNTADVVYNYKINSFKYTKGVLPFYC